MSVMPSEGTVRIGVLGCATIAGRRMLPAMVDSPLIDLVAVASRDGRKAAEFAGRFGCEAVTGYAELLERDDVDAVYVPLPSGLHAPWIRRAIAAGKHVLVEKPLATDPADARDVVARARESGLLLVESFMFLHHAQHRTVRELAGSIGGLRTFDAAFGFPPLAGDDIRYRADLGGGALFDVGVYPIRAAQYYLGDGLEVLAATRYEDPATGVDVRGTALLAGPDGVTAQLAYGFDHAYHSSITLWGRRGRLSLERAFTPPPELAPVVRRTGPEGAEEITLEPDHQFRNIAEDFAAAVLDGRDTTPYGDAIVRQAALVDDVRTRARRYTA